MRADHMNPADAGGYSVAYSGTVLSQFRAWRIRAVQVGVLDAYLDALATIHRQLGADPVGWGDPLYGLLVMRLLVCRRIWWGISVRYGVDETRRIVYPTDVYLVEPHVLGP
jgi:hypothetical protein